MSKCLVSIIIPCYNSEKYISDCLDSCLDQDLEKDEYEIICVNDGSTDNTEFILKDYAEKHSNIKYFSQENKGISASRNVGLQYAGGEYVWFIDHDDFIESDCLKFLIKNMIEKNIELLVIDYQDIDPNVDYCRKEKNYKFHVIDSEFVNTPWRIISKREIIEKNNILFDQEVRCAEDTLWIYQLRKHFKFVFVDSIIYNFRDVKNSESRSKDYKKNNYKAYSLLKIAAIYKKDFEQNKLNKRLSIRTDFAVQGALFTAMLSRKNEIQKDILLKAKKENLYPYKIMWKHIIPNTSLKHTIINWITLLFPLEWYYKFCCKILHYKSKRKI